MTIKFTQISAGEEGLFALDQQGRLWVWRTGDWKKLNMPDDEETPSIEFVG